MSEQNQGKTVNDICRKHNISQPTFYKWKNKYGGLDIQQLSKMKELERELSQYKNRCRAYSGKWTDEGGDCKKALMPCEKREIVAYLRAEFNVSSRKACDMFFLNLKPKFVLSIKSEMPENMWFGRIEKNSLPI